MTFVDTNYFLRFLLADNVEQHEKAKSLFNRAAKGSVDLFTSSVVLFELNWVFFSFYKKSRDEVVEILKKVLSMYFVEIEKRELIEEAVVLFSNSTLELEDCYNLCFARESGAKDFATFDKAVLKKL